MPIPYENATSGGQAIEDTRKLLQQFGCTRFGHMTDSADGVLILQFTYRGRDASLRASFKGYALQWLKANPWSTRRAVNQKTWEDKALAQSEISVCSILRDYVKAQVMMIESGILSFEAAFLGAILLPSGKTVMELVDAQRLLEGPK